MYFRFKRLIYCIFLVCREIGTITYRSGPEWDERFGRQRIKQSDEPSLCPYFMIENYLEYQGEQFCTRYDPNSLIYISKVRLSTSS